MVAGTATAAWTQTAKIQKRGNFSIGVIEIWSQKTTNLRQLSVSASAAR